MIETVQDASNALTEILFWLTGFAAGSEGVAGRDAAKMAGQIAEIKRFWAVYSAKPSSTNTEN